MIGLLIEELNRVQKEAMKPILRRMKIAIKFREFKRNSSFFMDLECRRKGYEEKLFDEYCAVIKAEENGIN